MYFELTAVIFVYFVLTAVIFVYFVLTAVIFVYFVLTAVIFVVDSSNRERLSESYSELAKLVQEKELKEASLLIFANKQVCY